MMEQVQKLCFTFSSESFLSSFRFFRNCREDFFSIPPTRGWSAWASKDDAAAIHWRHVVWPNVISPEVRMSFL